VVSPQRFVNGEVHDWYRIILGYSDHLVAGLLDEFEIYPGQRVLDPFCGTGTTLIECLKRGVSATGVDANPSSFFAASVKTNWDLDPGTLLSGLLELENRWGDLLVDDREPVDDPTYKYLHAAGMVKRGWISPEPLRKSIALKQAILDLPLTAKYRDFYMLGLIAEVVRGASNVKFGPELYCGPRKRDRAVFRGFSSRVLAMICDLTVVPKRDGGSIEVVEGDSRDLGLLLDGRRKFDALISSPPYPTEHDYTRNSRLELAFLESVTSLDTLRFYKKRMIRSHTKGIYVTDDDRTEVSRFPEIRRITALIDKRVAKKTDGFSQLYSTVVREYFGGMRRHLTTVLPLLKPGAHAAYVVGDQSSYASVHIPTAKILASLARSVGYSVVGIETWRTRQSTATQRRIGENILVLKRSQG
jgi:DNA modification methylase